MINETLRKNINVDKPNLIPIFNLKEDDDAILKLSLFKNSTEFDITGQTVRLGAKTKNGLLEQIDGFTISKNNLDIELKNSILVAGKIEIDLEIKDTNGVMTTASFFILVNQKVLNDVAVEATNEFDTFTKTVDKIESDYTGLRRIIIVENQAASLQDQINNVNSSLDNIESEIPLIKNEINKRTNHRPFKPNFGYNVMWHIYNTSNGTFSQKSKIDMINDIKLCESLNIDEITLALTIGYNASNDTLYSTVDLELVRELMDEYKHFNVKIKTVKIHFGFTEEYFNNSIGMAKFDVVYINFLRDICPKFQNTTVEHFTLVNEFPAIDSNVNYTTNVVGWLNLVKGYGYKVGVTSLGVEKNALLPSAILEASDLICINCYPKISFTKSKIIREDCKKAWLTNELKELVVDRRLNYPNKKIIISETGVVNIWEDLLGSVGDTAPYPRDNRATEVFLGGIFDALNDYGIDAVWWWFGIYTNNTKIQELFDYQLRGIINND